MGRGVPRQPLQHAADLDQLGDLGLLRDQLPQPRLLRQGSVQGDVEHVRDHLGDGIHLRQRDAQRAADIPDHGPRLELAEGNDLGNVVPAAVALHDVLVHVLPAVDAEIDVDVRHALACRVEKPLEDQAVGEGVEIRDAETVGDKTPGRRAPARPHRDAAFLGVTDEVGDDQKVAGKPHLLDDADFIIQALAVRRLVRLGVLGPDARHDPLEALARLELEELLRALRAAGVELGEMIGLEVELQVAAPGDRHRVGEGLRGVLEVIRHLGGRLEVQLVGPEFEPLRVVDGLAGLDAQQHVVGAHVLAGQVVAVVAGHQRDGEPTAHVDQGRVHAHLIVDAVVLNLEEEPVLAEHREVVPGGLLGLIHPARHDPARDFTVQAGRHGDQALRTLFQKFPVDPRLVVEAFQLGGGGQPAEIAVALLVLGQQDDMAEFPVVRGAFVETAAGGDVHLAADDRLDPRFAGLFVEFDGAEKRAVVGGGHRRHSIFGDPLQQVVDADGAVEQAVLGVYV